MDAKEYLRRLNNCSKNIKNLENEINILRSFGEIEPLQKAERLLDKKRKERYKIFLQITTALRKLTSPIEYDILLKRFVGLDNDDSGELKTMTLQEIADYYKKEYTWVTTMQGRGLKHLQQIIDEEGQ